jgi:hypothetical protein
MHPRNVVSVGFTGSTGRDSTGSTGHEDGRLFRLFRAGKSLDWLRIEISLASKHTAGRTI